MSDQKQEGSKPFDGFLFCFTGIKFDYREELSNNVRQLGGAVSKSYKGEVTHLIAKSKTSEKFEAAFKFNIPILLPSFVKDCYTSYKNNLSINMEKLILRHSFFPLRNKYVTISGFKEDRLSELEEMVQKLGGACKESFSSLCDYFICDNPSKDETMQVDAKGGIVCKAAWLESLLASIPTTAPSQLSITGLDTQQDFKFPPTCFFYLSHDFKSKESILFKERLLSQGAKVANEFNRLDATHYFIAGSTPSKNEKEELGEFMKGIKVVNQEWLDKCTKSGRLLESCVPLPSKASSSKEVTFWNELRVGKAEGSGQCTSNESSKTIFRGIYFSMVGLDHGIARFAHEAIAQRGGEMVNIEILVSPRIIILPFRGLELGNATVEKSEISCLVTAYWLQRCIDCNKLFDPSSHVLYSPLSTIDSLEGFSDVHVTVTGFSGLKRVLLMGLVRNLGGHWTESMTHRTTHLICSEFKGGKYDLALKKKALVVPESWLFHVAETRNIRHALVLQAIPQEHNPHFRTSKISGAPLASAASSNETSAIKCPLDSAKLTPTKSSILKGVVFFLYPSPEYNTAELTNKAHSMGATSLEGFELNRVTHLIVAGSKDYSASRTFRCAVQNSIVVVSHSWLEKCFETGRRQDELEFLYTQAPRKINRTNSVALQHSKPKIVSDLKDKGTSCSTQPKSEKQQLAKDLISTRLSAIIKETYKRKNQDQQSGALNLGPKISEMCDGHDFIEESAPASQLASLTLRCASNSMLEEIFPTPSFCINDMKQTTRERRHLLGIDAPQEVSTTNSTASKRPRTRSSLKAIIDLNSPPDSSFSTRRRR